MKVSVLRPEFVEFIPRELEEGVLYISDRYQTASHKCACGCGEKVVTPLSPADWQLQKDPAGLVSLHPSIGNWNHPCRSHYWIRKNRIQWAGPMSAREIARVKQKDLADKARYIEQNNQKKAMHPTGNSQHPIATSAEQQIDSWKRFVNGVLWLVGLRK